MHRTPDGLGLGWLRDLPDIRYFTPNTDQPKQGEERGVATLLAEAGTQPTEDPAACRGPSTCGRGSRRSRIRDLSVPAPPTRPRAWSSTSSARHSASTSMSPG